MLTESAITKKTELLAKGTDVISKMHFHMNKLGENLHNFLSHGEVNNHPQSDLVV
jgi:hypothetical protein